MISFTALFGRVEAAEFLSGVEVFVGPDEVLNEDVYIVAGRIIVAGTINGDLLAAGENIEVSGAVNGDLIIAGRSITITGAVEDDIRAAGADLQFLSAIGGDLIVAGNDISIDADSVIGEDLVAGANMLIIRGEIQGNLDLRVTEARFDGIVQGNVEAIVEDGFILGPESTIGGELTYSSLNDVSMQTGAVVVGEVTKQAPTVTVLGKEFQASTFTLVLNKFVSQIKWFIGTLLVGLILIWLFPETIRSLIATLLGSPWRSLGMGALILPGAPIVLLITMIVALSVVGFAAFPIVAVPAMVYASLLLLAKPVIAMVIGGFMANRVTKQDEYTRTSALVIGAAILTAVGLIPYLDSIVGWLTLLFGLGMWLLFVYRHYRIARVTQSA